MNLSSVERFSGTVPGTSSAVCKLICIFGPACTCSRRAGHLRASRFRTSNLTRRTNFKDPSCKVCAFCVKQALSELSTSPEVFMVVASTGAEGERPGRTTTPTTRDNISLEKSLAHISLHDESICKDAHSGLCDSLTRIFA